ncbi:hypothetical protein [Bythopirellula polymerisocia]|uniref:Uncharacterized protein n=1 Tax=Bythopirellula polymerisocia TaxID=2528003 RepID=A0A5C6D4X8_9BACT|nr:hypothetical protein [Bythopirellula polymerisocia]TWU29929.1 hypothetical protein Pla144_07100 [Bythopirellula polymerisocia]
MYRYPNTLAQLTYCTMVGILCAGLNVHLATNSQAQVNQASYQTPAAAYFSSGQGYYRQATVPQQAVATQVVQLNGNKPFQNIQRGPTVSPYLSLDMPETSTSLPNYYAYVRPQLQQRETNEVQAEEIRRLRQQVRMSGGRGSISKNTNEGMPTTGSSSQFLNLGSYFPGQ